MAVNVTKTLKELERTPVPKLKERYAEVFGEATRSNNKRFLIKRIIWRLQALDEGDLSERARRRAAELARDADLRLRPPTMPRNADSRSGAGRPPDPVVVSPFRVPADQRLPMPGGQLTRRYKGELIVVEVVRNGFEYEGETYRSLSAIARKVTGNHWNGYHFFKIPKPGKEAQSA